jgi:acetyl-CoA carboxylase carboxyltransferase component
MAERDGAGRGAATEPAWEAELAELERRREIAAAMGGEAAVARQHAAGKLTARERIELLLDRGSFRELGTLAGKGAYDPETGELLDATPANIVIGLGRVDGRSAVAAADDFTIRGGSSEATSPEKWQYAEKLAYEGRRPIVRLVDSAGGSVKLLEQQGATKIPGYPHWPFTDMLGVVPVVGVALGPCAGLGALRVVASHFSVMVRGRSQVFAAGPPVVGPGIGERVDKEQLGGYRVHSRGSGVVDNDAGSEHEALELVRRFLSYMPLSVFELPPVAAGDDDPERRDDELAAIIPLDKRRVYRVRELLEKVFDTGSILEIGRYHGRSSVTALARLDGHPVGVLANDPYHLGGALTHRSAEKLTRFVDLCDTFHLPVVNLVDQPGVSIGTVAEAHGTLRKAIRARMAINQTRVPWVSIFVRRAFGVAGAAYGPLGRLNLRYAWPSAEWGSIPIEGGVEAAFRRDIAAADDPAARRDELVAHYDRYRSPFRSAERFSIEEIIDPRETRPLLCEWIREAYRVLPEQIGLRSRTMRA